MGAQQFTNWSRDPDHAHYVVVCYPMANTTLYTMQYLKSTAAAVRYERKKTQNVKMTVILSESDTQKLSAMSPFSRAHATSFRIS